MGPELTLEGLGPKHRGVPSVQAGDEINLRGENFFTGCDDVGGSSSYFGCGEDPILGDEMGPQRDAPIKIFGPIDREVRRQMKERERPYEFDHEVILGTVDARDDFSFVTSVTVPKLEPGVYYLGAPLAYQRIRVAP